MADDDGKLSDFEKQALKDRTAELRKQAGRKGGSKKEKDLQDVLETIAGLPPEDKALAQMVHEIVTEVAPQLDAKTWYGFPAYARDGKIVVFFSQSSKFKARYSTLGFEEAAQLDDGDMWPVGFVIKDTTDAVRKKIAQLVKKAAG